MAQLKDMFLSSRHQSLTLCLVLSCILATACRQAVKSLQDMTRLRSEIIKQYGEKNVNVNLHNSVLLTITFVNSPLNSSSQAERANRAEQTASFVKEHYAAINQIEEIWVGFIQVKTRFIIVHYTQSLDFFGFDKHGQPLSPPEETELPLNSLSTLQTRATYSPKLDQTEVMIAKLQLEGDSNYGLAVAPHFTVSGDATGVRRAAVPPRTVGFDFASFSEKSMFPGEPKITILSDGKVVFETSAQFSTSKLPDGKFSEFLLLQIPYPKFRQMVAGQKLSITMGDRTYEFTREQVAALRDMTQYVKD